MKKPERNEKLWKYVWLAAGVFSVLLLCYALLLVWPQSIRVSHYTVDANIPSNLRIVQLTDLHNEEFGKENQKLIALVKQQEPDLIVITGDMLNRDDPDNSVIQHLVGELSEIAPVYYGYGNHEKSWERRFGTSLKDVLTEAGATVVECEYVDVELRGILLRIGGFSGFYGFTHMGGETEEEKVLEQSFYDTFTKTDRYRILLNHVPTQWLDWHRINDWSQDLVLCGHYHGGQVRIPFMDQGLIAPYVGWFPPYTKGCFVGKTATCILSTGLGNERPLIPRVNNPPEIVVVDINPEI